jgi:hypothetical protein
MSMEKKEQNLFLDKLLSIDSQLRHIIERVDTLEGFLMGNDDFIDKAIFPFAKDLKKIANQALNRLQEVGNENRDKIFGSHLIPDVQRR